MRKIDDEIQMLLKEHRGNIREILADNERLDLLYALSSQREMLLEWYDFDPEGELLQVGADYGAMTGLYRTSVSQVTVLDADADALRTVEMRYPGAPNIRYEKDTLTGYADVQTGNHRLNKTLSARRAQAVADALTAKGIAADRITADSQGDTVQPFATPEENRVTICITADAPGM